MIDTVLLGAHVILSFLPPVAGLTWLAAVVGAGMVWIFGRTSDQAAVARVKRRIQAGMLELRLFVDEPGISLRAQRGLIGANLRYLLLALRPALWMMIPVGLLLIHLGAFYERAPLPLGEPAIVTMGMSDLWDPSSPPPELIAAPGVAVLGSPVRILASREVSWRIVPNFTGSRTLRFRFHGEVASKWIEAGGAHGFVPGKSVRSFWSSVLSPGEGRIHADFAEWIEIRYPEADFRVFGARVNWLVWFLAVSMVAGWFLRKRFGVVI
ncbi:MAG: hypothetical protein ABI759_28935 [Candidatus Solibacter sp.]